MTTVPSQDDTTSKDVALPSVEVLSAHMEPGTTEHVKGSTSSLPSLSAEESRVFAALSETRHSSIGMLRARTDLDPDELRAVLDALRAKGLVTRLNTIVESYSSRFPGLRVGD